MNTCLYWLTLAIVFALLWLWSSARLADAKTRLRIIRENMSTQEEK